MLFLTGVVALCAFSSGLMPVYLNSLGAYFNDVYIGHTIEVNEENEIILNGSVLVTYQDNSYYYTANDLPLYSVDMGTNVLNPFESASIFYNRVDLISQTYVFGIVQDFDYFLDIETTIYFDNDIVLNGVFSFQNIITIDLLELGEIFPISCNSKITSIDNSSEIEQAYLEGRQEGYDIGYNDGLAVGNGVNNVVSWFGNIWDALASFFSLEIAPYVTIGTIFGVPIFVGALWFLLRALIN